MTMMMVLIFSCIHVSLGVRTLDMYLQFFQTLVCHSSSHLMRIVSEEYNDFLRNNTFIFY